MSTTLYPGIAFSPQTVLADNIGAADTIIPVADVSCFPDGPNLATIGTDETGETVFYAAKTADALSGCQRGVEGEARTWMAGEPVGRNFTAKDHNDLIDLLGQKQDKFEGKSGQVVGFNAEGKAVPQEPPVPPDAVTVPGGGKVEMEASLGEGPHTFEFTADDETAVSAAQVSYDGAASGLEAETVQGALDLLSVMVLSGGVPYGKELTESWAALQARILAGNFKGIRIGDFKTITLTTGEVVIMEVAGIDQYHRCGDVEIGHHIDFISRDCLAGTKVFNDTNTNNGTEAEPNPWRASKLFQTLNDEATGVIATLPGDLKPCIIDKRALLELRYSAAGALESSTGWAWNYMGKLWVPTEVEVFGNTFWSDGDAGWTGGGGCNLQYPIFYGGAKHIIKGAGNGGGRCAWWEATALRQSSTNVCCVDYNGGAHFPWATDGYIYAPLCFRIG
ncbi:hypothetical protein [uncultured Oscillibacter sp.]|uniref:hypothetical protein n=1 Tax=uncultured Oscillibacter sp. TaxID=876091 RepID=UPI00260D0603|nr:hypothetical protein [uncultured Oscillibacter sp.]